MNATDKYNREKFDACIKTIRRQQATAEAWQRFLTDKTWKVIAALGADIDEWYNGWATFDIRCRDLGDDRVLRKAIDSLMRDGRICGDDPRLFKRCDIYDKLAYASFPLSDFVETDVACKVRFSLPMPMVFAPSSFRLKRDRYAHGGDCWWGRLYIHDGRIEQGRSGDRCVAEERDFANSTTREDMFYTLLEKVEKQGNDALFTITGDGLIGAAIKAQSEAALQLPSEAV